MDAEDVRRRARAAIEFIELAQLQHFANLLREVAAERVGWPWARRARGYDEAFRLCTVDGNMEYTMRAIVREGLWRKDLIRAERLLMLGEYGDPVTVSAEDIYILDDEFIELDQ